jgi:hypothetical protein
MDSMDSVDSQDNTKEENRNASTDTDKMGGKASMYGQAADEYLDTVCMEEVCTGVDSGVETVNISVVSMTVGSSNSMDGQAAGTC